MARHHIPHSLPILVAKPVRLTASHPHLQLLVKLVANHLHLPKVARIGQLLAPPQNKGLRHMTLRHLQLLETDHELPRHSPVALALHQLPPQEVACVIHLFLPPLPVLSRPLLDNTHHTSHHQALLAAQFHRPVGERAPRHPSLYHKHPPPMIPPQLLLQPTPMARQRILAEHRPQPAITHSTTNDWTLKAYYIGILLINRVTQPLTNLFLHCSCMGTCIYMYMYYC